MMPKEPIPLSLEVVEMARAGRFADIREMFAPNLRVMVSADALQAAWATEVDRFGPVASVGEPVSEQAGAGTVVVRILVTFERGESTLIASVHESGWLVGLQLAPAGAARLTEPWEPPAYADTEAFDEQDVTVGSGPLAVPGTLTLPRQTGPMPAVVLLAGSGPNDRDETIGRNKPFKDLAWGLASHGIAVLRFDKVTFVHADKLTDDTDFTVVNEYIPDALAAVAMLQAQPAVDAARIFVLGHSLGGTVAPRVAAAEPAVAGLVILAGGTQPLHWAAVRQVRYLASLDPAGAAAAEPAIDGMTKQAEAVDSPDLSPSTSPRELPFGVPAPYWLDLRGYHPAVVAAGLGKPIFVLQGGRDYQVTIDDDLVAWKDGLAPSLDATIRVYDADNHFFFSGTGPSTPAEYEAVQHMDAAVVADIASWLTSPRAAGGQTAEE
jgi:uncharacterized protein